MTALRDHTDGIWEASPFDKPQWAVNVAGKKFHLICLTSQGNDEANAKRIAACVNKLALWTDEQLADENLTVIGWDTRSVCFPKLVVEKDNNDK